MAKVEMGDSVIVILRDPREKIVGILHEINVSGVFVRGVDLSYFDEWTRSIKNGEQFLPMQDYFFPMWRIERISRDEASADVPSLEQQFRQRTGFDLIEF